MSNLPVQRPSTGSASDQTQLQGRDVAVDYLRAFVIVLVVFLHAALAYTSFSTFDETRWVDSSAPVVDASRWPFLDWFVLFYDTFFMALLFLITGLFTISSLERKGSRDFFISRLQRLGIPFVVASLFIAPLVFRPSYLLALPEPQAPYLATFFTSDGWPVGPPWRQARLPAGTGAARSRPRSGWSEIKSTHTWTCGWMNTRRRSRS